MAYEKLINPTGKLLSFLAGHPLIFTRTSTWYRFQIRHPLHDDPILGVTTIRIGLNKTPTFLTPNRQSHIGHPPAHRLMDIHLITMPDLVRTNLNKTPTSFTPNRQSHVGHPPAHRSIDIHLKTMPELMQANSNNKPIKFTESRSMLAHRWMSGNTFLFKPQCHLLKLNRWVSMLREHTDWLSGNTKARVCY